MYVLYAYGLVLIETLFSNRDADGRNRDICTYCTDYYFRTFHSNADAHNLFLLYFENLRRYDCVVMIY